VEAVSLEAFLLLLLVLAICVVGWRVTTLLTLIMTLLGEIAARVRQR
jgi:hypothetical protein